MEKALVSSAPKPATALVRSDKGLGCAAEVANAADVRRPIPPTAKTIYRQYASMVSLAVEDILEFSWGMNGTPKAAYGMRGTPDYIKESKLRSIARRELRMDINLQLSKGFHEPSRLASKRMRTAIKRYLKKEAIVHRDALGQIHLQKPTDAEIGRVETEARKTINLCPQDLPALSQNAHLRIDAVRIYSRSLLRSRVSNYERELQNGSGLMKALSPEAQIKQSFNAFARDLGEAQANEYFTAHGENGVARWLKAICHLTVSEVLETTVCFRNDHISYSGLASACRYDLEAIVEAAVDRVINGTGGWREDMSRREKLKWFKVRNRIGKQNHRIYRAARVDRWNFGKWLKGLLPDSSSMAVRIETLLRSGRIN
jgi:hypothetical protein